MAAVCGEHRAFLTEIGGVEVLGEVTDLTRVKWNRVRDDVSTAEINIGSACAQLIDEMSTVRHELHIARRDDTGGWADVWQGPIVRIEFERSGANVFAEDIMWVAKKRAIEQGWNFEEYPNPPTAAAFAADLLLHQCFARYGDPWNMASRVRYIPSNDEDTYRGAVNAFQESVWQTFDHVARYYDVDYTVVGRDVFIWDLNLKWLEIPPLTAEHLSEWPRIVEYGNQFATRYVHTDGSGFAGVATAPDEYLDDYTRYIDVIANGNSQEEEMPDEVPSDKKLEGWQEIAEKNIDGHYPPPRSIVVPDNSTLLPASPWNVNELMPGSWFQVGLEIGGKRIEEYHRLQQVAVTQEDGAEQVQITTASPPKRMVTS